MQGVGRIQDSSAKARCSRGFAWLPRILSTPQMFRWGYVNTEESFCFCKIFLENNPTNEGKKLMLFIFFLIEIDFLHVCSYFLPANQNTHLKHTINQNSSVTSVSTYCHLNTPVDQWESVYYPTVIIISEKTMVGKYPWNYGCSWEVAKHLTRLLHFFWT